MTGGTPSLDPARATTEIAADIAAGNVTLPGQIDSSLGDATLERIGMQPPGWTPQPAVSVALLELRRRAAERDGPGWRITSHLGSAWQPSLAEVLRSLDEHLAGAPTVADTMWWLVHRYIVNVHERIAYSKLPEHTFRFRWEEGRVPFYDNGTSRFPLAAIRWDPLTNLTRDLNLWTLRRQRRQGQFPGPGVHR